MIRNAIRVVTSLWLLAAPATLAAQDTTLYLIPPPAPPPITCPTGPGGVQSLVAPVLESQVRQSCDASWKNALRAHTTGNRGYGDFMSQCAKACAASQAGPQAQATPSSVPQLTQLASSATSSTAAAALTTAGGLSTAVIIGAAAAGAAGIAAAVSSDGPASP